MTAEHDAHVMPVTANVPSATCSGTAAGVAVCPAGPSGTTGHAVPAASLVVSGMLTSTYFTTIWARYMFMLHAHVYVPGWSAGSLMVPPLLTS